MSWALALSLEAPWGAERAFKEREKERKRGVAALLGSTGFYKHKI